MCLYAYLLQSASDALCTVVVLHGDLKYKTANINCCFIVSNVRMYATTKFIFTNII
jgi:hypothetical protein